MTKFSDSEVHFMRRAIALSLREKGRTFPNPAVGAVIVAEEKIVGEGATQACGGSHAEIVAIKKAKEKASGSTLYVTLEPCCHFGRTPPCTNAVIAAGIKKVIVACRDPNPLVAGKGIVQLRRSGIEVISGLLRDEAAEVNEDFFWSITRKRAWVSVKLAQTLDGRIADELGGSKWITGEDSRNFVHELRRRHAAIAVGRITLEKDDPRLTVRHKKGYCPARIVFTSRQDLPLESYFYRHANDARSIVVLPGRDKRIEIDKQSKIEFWYTGKKYGRGHLDCFLETAYEQGLTSILVEGGCRLSSQFMENRLVNKLYLFYGNRILGRGRESMLFNKGFMINNCVYLDKIDIRQFGVDVLVSGYPSFPESI